MHVLRTSAAAVALAVVGEAIAMATPRVEPSVALSTDVAYDSNVFNGRGEDLVTRIAPHLALRIADQRLKLDLGYDLGFWVYASGTAENSINHRGVASLAAR